jgi:DNA polymerase epsilon subunit 1
VRLNLPRNRQRFHLYEWEIPEENYMGMKQVIEMQKSSPDVEGLYESQVPLWFRAIVELGCVCSVRPSSRSHSVQQNWELKHLQFIGDNTGSIGKKSPPPNYLPGSSLRYTIILNIHFRRRNFYVNGKLLVQICIFVPERIWPKGCVCHALPQPKAHRCYLRRCC